MKKLLVLATIFTVMAGAASAQSVQVDGLVEEDINTSLGENGVTFETSYLDKTLDYKDVFVPEQYHEHLADFDVNYDRKGNSGNVKFSIDFSFKDVDNSEELPNKLDGYSYSADFKDVGGGNGNGNGNSGGNTGGQTAWTVQSNIQQVSGNPIQEDADYDLKITGANNNAQVDGSLNRVNGSDQIVNDAPIDFNISSEEFAFDTGVFKPKVSSHYEHLIVEHEVRSSVSPEYGETLDIKENVYSGEDTTLLPVEGQINKYDGLNTPEDDYVDRMLFNWDRQYETSEENVSVVIAFPEEKNITSKNLGTNTYDVSGSEYYSRVESEAESLGRKDTLLNSTEGYKIKAFNTTVQGDTTVGLQYKINSELNESNDLRMWVLGSFAGGSGTSDDPYQIDTCTQLQEMENDFDASYELVSNIDCSGTSSWEDPYGFDPTGFDPIGNSSNTFTGVLNGNGFDVSGIYIDRGGNVEYDKGVDGITGAGLFGYIEDGTVTDLVIKNVDITGADSTGALAGKTDSLVAKNVVVKGGTVKDDFNDFNLRNYLGGMIGYIENSYNAQYNGFYSKADVSGSGADHKAGFVGYLRDSRGEWSGVYSTGDVDGGDGFAGSLGTYASEGDLTAYWDTETSGTTSSAEGTGLTTSEMTYPNAVDNLNFSFGSVYARDENTTNSGYPIVCGLETTCNAPPSVDSLNTPSNDSTIYTLSPSLGVDVSDPDGDSMTVEYFLNGSSIGSNSGVTDGSDSLEASGLDWETQYNWYVEVSDGNGGTTTSSTYSFTTGQKPELDSLSLSNSSNILFGDSVYASAEVSDPEGQGISETLFSGSEGDTSIFSDVGGTNPSGTTWESQSVNVDKTDTQYTFTVEEATSTFGATETFGDTVSFTVDSPTISVSSPTNINAEEATLDSSVSNYGDFADGDLSYYYQYRETGSSTWQETSSIAFDSSNSDFTKQVANLTASTEYEYRMVTSWNGGDKTTGTQTFTTDSPTISISLVNPSTDETRDWNSSGQDLTVEVDSNVDATYDIQVDGSTEKTGTLDSPNTQQVTATEDLDPASYDVNATVSTPDYSENDLTNTNTLTIEDTIAASTDAASDVNYFEATLNGNLDTRGADSSVDIYFEYKKESDSSFQTTAPVSVTSSQSLSETVDLSSDDTTYEYRTVAESQYDTDKGSLQNFTTQQNSPPTISDKRYTDSNPSFGDNIEFRADVSDAEIGVNESSLEFTVYEGNTQILQETPSKVSGSTFETSSFQIDEADTDYRAEVSYAEDTEGFSTSSSQQGLSNATVRVNNTAPSISNQRYNNSAPEYEDEVEFKADVSDQEYGVNTVQFTVWEGGNKIIDGQTPTSSNADTYTSPSFTIDEVDTEYEAQVSYAEDNEGLTTDAPSQGLTNASISTDNSPPTIQNMTFDPSSPSYEEGVKFKANLSDEQVGLNTSTIEFTVYRNGQQILQENPSKVSGDTFETSSFQPSSVETEYTGKVTFVEDGESFSTDSDSKGLQPANFSIPNTAPTIQNLRFNNSDPDFGEKVTFLADVSDQEVGLNESSIEFEVYKDGSQILKETPAHISGDTFETQAFFRPDDVNAEYTAKVVEAADDEGYSASSDSEGINAPSLTVEAVDVENSEDINVVDRNFETVSLAKVGEEVRVDAEYLLENKLDIGATGELKNVPPSNSEFVSTTDFSIGSETQATKDVLIDTPVGNRSSILFGTIKENEPTTDYDTYVYESSIDLNSNLTSQNRIQIFKINDDSLTDFGDRPANTVKIQFEDPSPANPSTSTEYNIETGNLKGYIETSSPSMYEGSYDFNISYESATETVGSIGGGGGGGGGSIPEEDEEESSDSVTAAFTDTTIDADYGTEGQTKLVLTNYEPRADTVNIQIPDKGLGKYIKVETEIRVIQQEEGFELLRSDESGKNATYDLLSSEEGLTGSGFNLEIPLKYDIPSEAKVAQTVGQEQGLQVEIKANSTQGYIENPTIKADTSSTIFSKIQNFGSDLFSAGSSIVQTREICLDAAAVNGTEECSESSKFGIMLPAFNTAGMVFWLMIAVVTALLGKISYNIYQDKYQWI